jgi:thiol-disulfide isomerase/thioredoxin
VQRYLVWAAVAVAALVVAWIAVPYFSSPPAASGGPGGVAGQSAPVFVLHDDRGASVSLDRYRGSVIVMNLWASWCPPCRAEMPDLQRLEEAYGHRGLAIVGVNEGESAERARAFAGALGITFPIWIDASQRYGRVYSALGLPTTVILDRHGIVLRGFDGPLTFDEMRSAVAAALTAS